MKVDGGKGKVSKIRYSPSKFGNFYNVVCPQHSPLCGTLCVLVFSRNSLTHKTETEAVYRIDWIGWRGDVFDVIEGLDASQLKFNEEHARSRHARTCTGWFINIENKLGLSCAKLSSCWIWDYTEHNNWAWLILIYGMASWSSKSLKLLLQSSESYFR